MKIAALGSGLGGNNMAVRFVSEKSDDGEGQYSYIGLDTNHRTLDDVQKSLSSAGVKESRLVVLAKSESDPAEGSGFDPMFAARAFWHSVERVTKAVIDSWVVIAFFAFGKGTGTGTCLMAIRLMLRLGILPFAVISLPPTANPSESKLHRARITKLHRLGVRVIVTDSSALRTNAELKKLSIEDGWKALDQVVLRTIRLGLALILRESSQIDMSDVTRRFLFGQGFLVPVYGNYGRPEQVNEPALPQEPTGQVEAASPKKLAQLEKKREKHFLDMCKDALEAAWKGATPSYYERGAYMERAIICLTGQWSSEEEEMLEGFVRGYHRVANTFKTVYARFDTGNTSSRSFAVLYAAAPKKPVENIRKWAWKRPQVELSQIAVLTSSSTLALIPALPLPLVTSVTAEVLHREVFRDRINPAAISFSQFMAASKGVTNKAVLELLASTPDQLIALCGNILSKVGGNPSQFKLGFTEYQAELGALLKDEIAAVLSPQFKWDIIQKALDSNFTLQPVMEVRIPGSLIKKRVTIWDANGSDQSALAELDSVIQGHIDESDLVNLRNIKKLRQLLGPLFVNLIVRPDPGGNAQTTGNGLQKTAVVTAGRIVKAATDLLGQIRTH